MPLPDERPRQSVANLIGRFEQQTKRPAIGSPRNSGVGVLSHSTGDSANEESLGKEKREWPPKPVSANDKPPPPIIPSSSWTRQLVQATPPQPAISLSRSNSANLPLERSANDLVSSSTPSLTIVPEPEPLPTPQGQLDQASETAQPISRPSQRSPTSPVRVPAPRRTTTPKASLGTAAKSPPKTSLGTTSRPLKPQLTGQSTVSSATTTTRQSKVISKTAPSTPSQKNNAPSPKPPASMTSRPKTPSSGLFAPTAASLARARNAAPQLPTPTKKATLSSDAADRLSKPTAASLSKARTAQAAAASPARTVAKTARGGSRVAAKPKAGPAGGKISQEKESTVDSALENEHPENGHGIEGLVSTEHVGAGTEPDEESHEESVEINQESLHDVSESLGSEGAVVEVEFGIESSISHGSLESSTPLVPEHDSQPQSQPEPQPEPQMVPTPELATDLSSDLHQTPENVNEVKPPLVVVNDIETMVNLLETVPIPKVRRLSIASIPDEDVHEIPDED